MVTVANGAVAGLQAIGGVVGYVIGYVAWKGRDHPASGPLFWMSVLPGTSAFCYAAVSLLPRSPGAGLLLGAANAGIAIAPGLFVLFTLRYTGHGEWLTPRRRAAILAVFTFSSVIVALQVALFSPVEVRTIGRLTLPVIVDRRLAILATLVFSYPAIIASFALLGTFLVSPRNVYRKQTAVIVLGFLLTVVGNLVFEAGLSPHPGLNLTSVFFSLQMIVIALALFRYEFLNVEPLAPDVVLDEIDDPVLVIDESDVLVDANPAAERLFETSDPIGQSIRSLLPGFFDAIDADELYVHPNEQLRTDGGQAAVYDLNEAPIRDQYDQSRGTVVVLRDVTLLKQRERTLESLQSVSQEFLRASTKEEVFDIAVRTADEVLDYPYSGAMRYDEAENVMRPAAFTDALVAAYEDVDDADPVVEPGNSDVWRAFQSGEPVLGDPIEPGDDSDIPVELGGSLLYPLGEHGVLGVSAPEDHTGFSEDDRRFADILARSTENALDRIEKESELRRSREQLAERNEQIEFFNGILRHDLLNGMLVVQGRADQLRELVDGEAAEHVETIAQWSRDITDLAERVRSVSTAVTSDEAIEPGPISVTEHLRERADKIRRSHPNVSVSIDDSLDDLPAVRADEMLPAVFENLLGNAVEHNDTDRPEIDVSATTDGETVTIRIADNGPGIDEEIRDEVFEERFTADGSGSIGFGLYFVRVMVETYGGSIRLENDSSRGAVAVLELQVAEAARE